ncbi:MAG: alpha-1,2-fucosyltransferase [Prevotella sp.]|nr:alpha-1,2-fucosyltransferase [Prevotella sp.]
MIFARDKSQMCNNLLQYAHVYAWGREHGRKVISMRFSYKYQYFHICHTNLTGFGWYLFAKYMAALHLLPTASFKHADCDREAQERKMLRHRHIVVSGWNVRFYDLFLKYRSEIVELFRIDECYTQPVREKMNVNDNVNDNVEGQRPKDEGQRPKAKGQRLLPQSLRPVSLDLRPKSQISLGVHIRRGDYATWQDGRYFFNDKVYASYINRFAAMHPDQTVDVFLSTNDAQVTAEHYQALCPKVRIHHLKGSAPEDLFMLSECDYLIGPPSTFSLVAAMYRDIPLYRMDSADADSMTADGFRLFDYWFRRIL